MTTDELDRLQQDRKWNNVTHPMQKNMHNQRMLKGVRLVRSGQNSKATPELQGAASLLTAAHYFALAIFGCSNQLPLASSTDSHGAK